MQKNKCKLKKEKKEKEKKENYPSKNKRDSLFGLQQSINMN
jgi:hypothetical protein